jgi:hypothetical protein
MACGLAIVSADGVRRATVRKFLARVVELLHGVKLSQYDRDGRQRAVDYVFNSESGNGAVEPS